MTDTDMLYMASLDRQNEELAQLLREARKLMKNALFVNHKDTAAANEWYDKVRKMIGEDGESNE